MHAAMSNTQMTTSTHPTQEEIALALEELSLLIPPLSDAEIDEMARLNEARRYHHHSCHEI